MAPIRPGRTAARTDMAGGPAREASLPARNTIQSARCCEVLFFIRPAARLIRCRCSFSANAGPIVSTSSCGTVGRARLHCLTCGHEAWLEGFTVSDFDPAKLLTAAVIDQARKHRKRPPDEATALTEQRRVRSR